MFSLIHGYCMKLENYEYKTNWCTSFLIALGGLPFLVRIQVYQKMLGREALVARVRDHGSVFASLKCGSCVMLSEKYEHKRKYRASFLIVSSSDWSTLPIRFAVKILSLFLSFMGLV